MTKVYSYLAPLPKLENSVYSALIECGGTATANQVFDKLDGTIELALIYTVARRLEKKGMLLRQEREYDFGPLGRAKRTTYVATQSNERKDTDVNKAQRKHVTGHMLMPFSTAAPGG